MCTIRFLLVVKKLAESVLLCLCSSKAIHAVNATEAMS